MTGNGFKPGMCINMKRQARANQAFSMVTGEQIEKLGEIGMNWDDLSQRKAQTE